MSLLLNTLKKNTKNIEALAHLGSVLNQDNEVLRDKVWRACNENLWFTEQNCWQAIKYWSEQLTTVSLEALVENYVSPKSNKNVAIVMAGNLPLVGLHDVVMALLAQQNIVAKPSSEDAVLMKYVLSILADVADSNIIVTDTLPKNIDAVIATGSNNSYRYFEYYFRNKPSVLRKNRRSVAVLSGNETDEELDALSNDIFWYFGMGCRNVSLVLLPRTMNITRVIDHFEGHRELSHHNRFANNYTYHKALFLMNRQEHLDNGFICLKEDRSLTAPLGCLFYSYYDSVDEVEQFIREEADNIQCIVGKNYKQSNVPFGNTQSPELQDFADGVDTLQFLLEL